MDNPIPLHLLVPPIRASFGLPNGHSSDRASGTHEAGVPWPSVARRTTIFLLILNGINMRNMNKWAGDDHHMIITAYTLIYHDISWYYKWSTYSVVTPSHREATPMGSRGSWELLPSHGSWSGPCAMPRFRGATWRTPASTWPKGWGWGLRWFFWGVTMAITGNNHHSWGRSPEPLYYGKLPTY